MMGVAVQTVTFQMQREREAELIFRGEQYIEAIRLFKTKYGRNPMTLKEIWEADPRVIRNKWKDPITDSYNWGLIFVGQEGRPVETGGQVPGSSQMFPTPTPTPASGSGGFGKSGQPGQAVGPDAQGPIAGVHSTSCEDSIKLYEGRSRYCDWRFVLKDQQQGRPAGGGTPGGGGTEDQGGTPGDGTGDQGGAPGDGTGTVGGDPADSAQEAAEADWWRRGLRAGWARRGMRCPHTESSALRDDIAAFRTRWTCRVNPAWP